MELVSSSTSSPSSASECRGVMRSVALDVGNCSVVVSRKAAGHAKMVDGATDLECMDCWVAVYKELR